MIMSYLRLYIYNTEATETHLSTVLQQAICALYRLLLSSRSGVNILQWLLKCNLVHIFIFWVKSNQTKGRYVKFSNPFIFIDQNK